jgi:hypothetical protein
MSRLIQDTKNRHPQFKGIIVEMLESDRAGDSSQGPVIELPKELGIRLPNSQTYLIRIDYNVLQLHIFRDVYPLDSEEARFVINVVSLSESEGAGWLWRDEEIDTETLALKLLEAMGGRFSQFSSGLVA